MRSQLNEAYQIDRYLLGQLGEEEAREFETALMLDSAFAEKVEAQRSAHRLVRLYARAQERGRLETIYRRLMTETAFSHQITTIFA